MSFPSAAAEESILTFDRDDDPAFTGSGITAARFTLTPTLSLKGEGATASPMGGSHVSHPKCPWSGWVDWGLTCRALRVGHPAQGRPSPVRSMKRELSLHGLALESSWTRSAPLLAVLGRRSRPLFARTCVD